MLSFNPHSQRISKGHNLQRESKACRSCPRTKGRDQICQPDASSIGSYAPASLIQACSLMKRMFSEKEGRLGVHAREKGGYHVELTLMVAGAWLRLLGGAGVGSQQWNRAWLE